MSKIYVYVITLLTVASLAFATEEYQLSWSSQQAASQPDLKIQAAGFGLPDSVLQIKNVRANIDLDKDGKMEFMVPVMWEDADGVPLRSIYLYENTGNDRYDMVWSYTFPDSADQFVTVDVSDLDGDGMLEILAVNVRKPGSNDAGPNLYVFENVGDNDYGTEPTITWDLGNSDRDVVRVAKAADLDGDGKQEVVMTAFLTQPAIVIASVSDFTVPVWTTEYINNEIGGVAPDIAAIGIGDMDNDGTPEVVLTEGATDKLLVIEATAANTYGITEVDIPVAGKRSAFIVSKWAMSTVTTEMKRILPICREPYGSFPPPVMLLQSPLAISMPLLKQKSSGWKPALAISVSVVLILLLRDLMVAMLLISAISVE